MDYKTVASTLGLNVGHFNDGGHIFLSLDHKNSSYKFF